MTEKLTREFFIAAGRRGGRKSSSQRWRSTRDPSLVSTAAGLARLLRTRGWDVNERERISEKK